MSCRSAARHAAAERDPHYGVAFGTAAFVRVIMDLRGAAEDPGRNQDEAVKFARRAVEVAPDDPGALCYAGLALGYFGEDIESAITLIDRCIALNPSYAQGWLHSGMLHTYAGNFDVAIKNIETSMRLDPRARMAAHLTGIGSAHFFAHRFDLAIPKLLAAVQQLPTYPPPRRFLAACYAHLGRMAEAQEVI
jgi:adenylate cyclase